MARKSSNKKTDKDERKKKRKVGRPKKRGRKKNYYKAKKKSVGSSKNINSPKITYSRVRHVLWENFKDDFPSYRAFISNESDSDGKKIKGSSIVSRVYNECKSLECNDDDIISIYRQLRGQSKDDLPPQVPYDYYEPKGYWQIITDDFWNGMEERLWVVSSDLLFEPDYFLGILGNDIYVDNEGNKISFEQFQKEKGRIFQGKKWRFQEWVNWCNSLQLQHLVQGSDEVPHFRFAGRTDEEDSCYWNDIQKRWEIRIISCDKTGFSEDFGFTPEEPDLIDPTIIENAISKTPETPSTVETPSTIIDKDLELKKAEAEIEKSKAIQEQAKTEQKKIELEEAKVKRQMAIIDLFAQGKISEKKMDEMLKMLK